MADTQPNEKTPDSAESTAHESHKDRPRFSEPPKGSSYSFADVFSYQRHLPWSHSSDDF